MGVHTETHPSLPLYNFTTQYEEIGACKQSLEKRYNKSLQTISYPYGDYNDDTLEIVRQKSLKGAFTTQARIVTQKTNPVTIGRFQVKNWNGQEFEKHLTAWFNQY
jgi:hypothetical protein